MELLASGEPEEIEHLSDEEPDERPGPPGRPPGRRLRTVAPFVAALTVGALLGGVAIAGWRDREKAIQAASTATLGLTLEQAVPAARQEDPSSGDFETVSVYLVVENRSPGPVRVDSVQPAGLRGLERAVVHAWRPRDLAPAERVRVRLDVRPDCGDAPGIDMPALRFSVTPEKGGRRDVRVEPPREPDSRDYELPFDASYLGVMTTQCERARAAEDSPGFHLYTSSFQLLRGRGRTATLKLGVLAESGDGPSRPDGLVTRAELTLPGVRVVQPKVPLPLAGSENGSETALVFSLTMDRCDLALAKKQGVLDVRATAGTLDGSLERWSSDLGLEVLKYIVDTCR